jgi:signal transduction histidine kinase
VGEKDSRDGLTGAEAGKASQHAQKKEIEDPAVREKSRAYADYETRCDVADLVWDAYSADAPIIDEHPEFDSSPRFLKGLGLPGEDPLAKNVTETGSFDLRWITMASFGKLLDAIPTPVTLVHADGEIQLVNSAFERLADDPATLKTPSFFDFFPGKQEEIRSLTAGALTLRKPQEWQGVLTVGAKEVWAKMRLRPIRFGSDRSILAVIEDLSLERRELTLNAKYRKLVGVFPIGIAEFSLVNKVYVKDPPEEILAALLTARMTDGNSRFANMHGPSRSSATKLQSLKSIVPDVAEHIQFYLRWIKNKFSMTPYETKEIWEDGEIRYFENTLVANFDGPLITHFWLMKQDITEHIRVQEELVRKIKTIDELYEHIVQSHKSKAIAQHTANVAHELRQPLAIIGGFTRRMAKESAARNHDTAEMEELNIIIKEIQRLERILGGLIDFTRRETLTFQNTSPNDLIEYVVKINRNRLQDKNLAVQLDLGTEVREIPLDTDRFQHVVRNLLANAIEAAPVGSTVRVCTGTAVPSERAHRTGELDADSYFEMKIENRGKSIPQDDVQRIFDPFYTTKDDGSGLGLTLVKKLVEDHRGSISLKSDDESTVFTIWLPMEV